MNIILTGIKLMDVVSVLVINFAYVNLRRFRDVETLHAKLVIHEFFAYIHVHFNHILHYTSAAIDVVNLCPSAFVVTFSGCLVFIVAGEQLR